MKCQKPGCNSEKTRVLTTFSIGSVVIRERICLVCGCIFRTSEKADKSEKEEPVNVK